MSGPAPVLALRHIDKAFPGVKALDDVSLEVRPHEVVGLVGENGAGKSTLMRILAGVYQPDAGTLELHGAPVVLRSRSDAARHGIGMVFQEQSLLPNLSVAENIYLGAEQAFTRGGLVRWRELNAAARRQLDKVQMAIDPAGATAELDFAARQMVELAKALTLEEQAEGHLIILLDEPTSVLEQADIDILFARVRALKARASFVFVSHRLDEVLALSDRIYVMKDGRVVAELPAAGADAHRLHQLMVGRGRQAEYYRESKQRPHRAKVLLAAEGLSLAGAYREVDLALHEGEILGIAGVIGSGREALCRTLFGFEQPDQGRILVDGAPVRLSSPSIAAAHGIGYVPRERRTEGLVLFLSIAANVTLASLERVAARRPDRPSPGEAPGAELGRQAPGARARHPGAVPQPLGRQPAEGRARQVAQRALPHPDPRPSDPRPRRRRQGGGVRIDPRAVGRWDRDHPDRRHARGDDRAQPHHPGDARRRRHPALRRQPGPEARAGRADRAHGLSAGSAERERASGCERIERGGAAAGDAARDAGPAGGAGRRGDARVPDRADPPGAGVRHRDPVRDGGRRDLRDHAGRDRPVDPVGRLAQQRDRRALPCRASAISASSLATLAGALAGVLAGVAHVKLRIPSFIATLAIGGIAAGTALIISDARAITLDADERTYLGWITGTSLGLPHEVIIGAVVLALGLFLQRYTAFGRYSQAIGAGEPAAYASGVRVDRHKIIACVLSGGFAGFAGVILAGRLASGSPTLANELLLPAIAAVIVGGTAITGGVGSVWRTLVGALIISVVRIGMTFVGVDIFAQQIVFGSVLILAVAVTIDRSKIPIVK